MEFKKFDIPFYKKKSLGQRFLKNKNSAQRIVEALNIQKDDTILEIGAGKGILTEFLLEKDAEVYSVEIDKRLIDFLKDKFKAYSNLKIINKNILDLKLSDYCPEGKKLKVIGNIPYHLTSSIIFKMIEEKEYMNNWIMTVQREVAQRIVSPPDSKKRGVLSVILQFYGNPEIVFYISNKNFSPVPKVDSAVVKYKFYPEPEKKLKNEKKFIEIVKVTFGKRRKTLRNSLKGVSGINLDRISEEIDLKLRPENLTVEDFVQISNLSE